MKTPFLKRLIPVGESRRWGNGVKRVNIVQILSTDECKWKNYTC
jgi:hypothetical protein